MFTTLSSRCVNPLLRNNKHVIKRAYSRGGEVVDNIMEFYGKWLYGHIAVGMFGGAIGAPILVSYSAYENSKSSGKPIDKGGVFVASMLSFGI